MKDDLKKHLAFISPEYKQLLAGGYVAEITKPFSESKQLTEEQVSALDSILTLFCVFMLSTDDLYEVVRADLGTGDDDTKAIVATVLAAFPDEFIASHDTITTYLQGDDSFDQSIYAAADKHGLVTEQQKAILLEIAEEVSAGSEQQAKLPDLIVERVQITKPEALKITADLIDILSVEEKKTPVASQPTSPGSITDDEMLEVEIAEAEASLKSAVQPIRTMAHDMEVARHPEPTHQASSQADLLNKTQ